MKRSSAVDDAILTLVMVVWGFNFVLVKIALRDVDVFALMLLRNGSALAVLAAVFLAIQRKWPRRPAQLGRVFLTGLLGVTMQQVFFNLALHYTSAANAALLGSTSPIFGLFLARIFEGERSSNKRWLGAAMGLVGVALIMGGGRGSFEFGGESLLGDVFMLVAACSYTLYAMIGRPVLKDCSPTELSLLSYFFGVPLLLPVTAGAVLAQPWSIVSALGWACAIGLGLTSALSSVLWYRCLGKVGISRAMVFMYLSPLSGVLGAMLVLNETITITQSVGAAVVLLGVNTARTG